MNAIFISLGGISASALGCYGNWNSNTPHLDQLASQCHAFDRFFTDRPNPCETRKAWWLAGDQHVATLVRTAGYRSVLIRDNRHWLEQIAPSTSSIKDLTQAFEQTIDIDGEFDEPGEA